MTERTPRIDSGTTGRSTPEWIAKTPDDAIPARVRLRVFDRFGGICQVTGRRIAAGDEWDCDHKDALADGGEHRESNLRPVLRQAHRQKTAAENTARAKERRVRRKHFGIKPKPKAVIAGSKLSGWHKPINGPAVRRPKS